MAAAHQVTEPIAAIAAIAIEPIEPIEPILRENPLRFVLFPIEYDDVWLMYKKALACFWTIDEVDLAADIVD